MEDAVSDRGLTVRRGGRAGVGGSQAWGQRECSAVYRGPLPRVPGPKPAACGPPDTACRCVVLGPYKFCLALI